MTDPTDAAASAESDLWRYAITLYAADGVAPLCLRLQDAHGLDVPFLLFAHWRGARGGLSDAALTRAESVSAAWSAQTVHPLRAVRRALKSGPPADWPAQAPDAGAVERLRADVKAQELAAEKLLLAALAAIAAEDDGAGGDRLEAAAIVERHRSRCGAPEAARADLEDLARRAAAMQMGDE